MSHHEEEKRMEETEGAVELTEELETAELPEEELRAIAGGFRVGSLPGDGS